MPTMLDHLLGTSDLDAGAADTGSAALRHWTAPIKRSGLLRRNGRRNDLRIQVNLRTGHKEKVCEPSPGAGTKLPIAPWLPGSASQHTPPGFSKVHSMPGG